MVITSYELYVKDKKIYQRKKWDVLAIDEGHRLFFCEKFFDFLYYRLKNKSGKLRRYLLVIKAKSWFLFFFSLKFFLVLFYLVHLFKIILMKCGLY